MSFETRPRVPPFTLKPGADRTVVPGLVAIKQLPVVWDAEAARA